MRYFKVMPLAMLGLFGMVACKNQNNDTKTKMVEVPVFTVEPKSVTVDQLYVTDIRAVRNVELRTKVSGFLDAIYVDEGQAVKKGQILFKIGDSEYRSEVAKARAVLNTTKAEARIAELEYTRVKLLVEKNIVSKTELELNAAKVASANAKVEEAESAVQNASLRLSYTVIRAPFDGIVDRIPLRSGSLLSEGSLITTVSDISTVYAYFNISENEYLRHIRKAARGNHEEEPAASLILSDGATYEHKGKIETVVSEFDENTGSISFRASFPNPGRLLKHRATGKVKLSTDVEEALVIPQKASFEIQDKTYVYLLDARNVIRMKSFVPAGRLDDYYIVKSGLEQGDRIVYEGIQDLREGVTVAPRTVSQESLPRISAL